MVLQEQPEEISKCQSHRSDVMNIIWKKPAFAAVSDCPMESLIRGGIT